MRACFSLEDGIDAALFKSSLHTHLKEEWILFEKIEVEASLTCFFINLSLLQNSFSMSYVVCTPRIPFCSTGQEADSYFFKHAIYFFFIYRHIYLIWKLTKIL
jgi:hypothetical protein